MNVYSAESDLEMLLFNQSLDLDTVHLKRVRSGRSGSDHHACDQPWLDLHAASNIPLLIGLSGEPESVDSLKGYLN